MNKSGMFYRQGRWISALLVTALMLTALASPVQAQQSPTDVIRQNIDSLMSEIDGRKSYFAQNEGELSALVDRSMEGVADFRYIGASVMGRYFRGATPEQRSRFVQVFRQTLVDTYARGLVTFDYDTLRVSDNQDTGRYEDQASVAVEVISTQGETFPVNFTLRQNDGEWQVINVIVNGINLGLTFRNQFDQAMRDNNRDVDAVISNWSPEVGTDELEQGGDS